MATMNAKEPAVVASVTKETFTDVPKKPLQKIGEKAPTYVKGKLNKGGASRVA